MKSKIGLAVLIVIVLAVAIVAVVIVAGGISLGWGSKVTIQGTVSYSMWPGPGWGVVYNNHVIQEDGIFALLWYFPWETKDINIVVEIDNEKTYSADCWAGKTNIILGSNAFSVELRHIPDGTYSGKIFVYEVEKGFLFGEKNRVLQASTNFEVIV